MPCLGALVDAEWLNGDALERTPDVIYHYERKQLFAKISCELASELSLISRALRLDSTSQVLYDDYEDSGENENNDALSHAGLRLFKGVPADVEQDFRNDSILKDGRVVYIRFTGTHAQYDKIDVQTI